MKIFLEFIDRYLLLIYTDNVDANTCDSPFGLGELLIFGFYSFNIRLQYGLVWLIHLLWFLHMLLAYCLLLSCPISSSLDSINMIYIIINTLDLIKLFFFGFYKYDIGIVLVILLSCASSLSLVSIHKSSSNIYSWVIPRHHSWLLQMLHCLLNTCQCILCLFDFLFFCFYAINIFIDILCIVAFVVLTSSSFSSK